MNKAEIEKEKKRIRNKRTGRVRTIVGWACLIVGVLDLYGNMYAFNYSFMRGLEAIILPLLMACLGGWLVKTARSNVAKWNKYDSFINQNGNTSLKMLSRKTGIPINTVRKDIQEMINNGFFKDEEKNIAAYIHGEYDILVMMRNGVPIESIENTLKREEAAEKEDAAKVEEPDGKRVWNEDDYANAIATVAADVKDPDVVESLKSIENSLRKIYRLVKRRPEMAKQEGIKQLREVYLPKTIELAEKLWTGDAGSATMLEIKGILNTCAIAYKNIVDKAYKREDEDTLIDIEVLQQTFEREGLLDSDFDL